MTREECEGIEPGMTCLIGDHFVEEPYEEIRKYLGTIQTVDRIDFDGGGWIFFDGISQPFAFSEVVCVKSPFIDDENVPYQLGDICLIFGEV